MDITQDPRPLCIGRFTVDIPYALHPANLEAKATVTTKIEYSGVEIIIRHNVTLEEFNQTVEQRWKELSELKPAVYEDPYVQPSSRTQMGENAWILAFKHHEFESNARWEGEKRVYDIKVGHEAEGYLWNQETMFIIKDRSHLWENDDIKNIMSRLKLLAMSDTPTELGLCLNGALIESFYAERSESIIWSIDYPSGLVMVFITASYAEEGGFMLERIRDHFGIGTYPHMLKEEGDKMSYTTYRAAHREDHLPADEIIYACTFDYSDGKYQSYKTEVSARWEFPGEGRPATKPHIRFDMGFDIETDRTPAKQGVYPEPVGGETHPTEKEFFALWDAIAGSIRFEGNALTPKPEPAKPEPPPMPNAQQVSRDKNILDDFLRNG